jgi:hypothetical protein
MPKTECKEKPAPASTRTVLCGEISAGVPADVPLRVPRALAIGADVKLYA